MYCRLPYFKLIVVFLFISSNSEAQICSGNLGAPVFNEDFGSGSSLFGPPLATSVTSYPYFSGIPFNGSYSIANYSDPNGVGYIPDNDHTGNVNGYMMLVNADYPQDEVYRRNVTGLCPNTTYVFSAYLANTNPLSAAINNCGAGYIYANIKFQIEYPTSIIQGSVASGNLPISTSSLNLDWVQYGYAFTTGPAQTSVDVVMINNAPGGCGNDYALDDITLSPCGPGVSLSISPNASVFCQGQPITLLSNFTSGTYTVPQYQWQFSNNNGLTWNDIVGATSSNYSIAAVSNSNIGLYQLLVAENGNMSNSNCRIIAGPLTFSLASLSVNSSTICSGQTTTLSAFGASSYTWSNGATNNSITVTPNSTSSFSVMGSTGFCTLQAVSNVSVIPAPTISVVGNTLICQGNTTTLTASGYTNYLWSNGSTAPAIVVSPSATSLYSVTSSISLCANIGIVTVSVIPVPTVSISSSIACVGQSFTITSNASSGVTYQWAGPNSFISSLQNPTFVTANISMSGVYNLTVTSTQGCINTTNANVSVVPLPIPVISVNYTAICAGINLNL